MDGLTHFETAAGAGELLNCCVLLAMMLSAPRACTDNRALLSRRAEWDPLAAFPAPLAAFVCLS